MSEDRIHAQSAPTWLDLYDYRQRVVAMYRRRNLALQAGEDAASVCRRFREEKDQLFANHPQSALEASARATFTGLRYYPYDTSFCVQALLTPLDMQTAITGLSAADTSTHGIPHRPAAYLEFEISGAPARLMVYWLDVYGGGLFLPFRDATCPEESYGAGRYLFDTVKGSDFIRQADAVAAPGFSGGSILLDFNYTYNPSWISQIMFLPSHPVPIPFGLHRYLFYS
jgi:uncharacterized protein